MKRVLVTGSGGFIGRGTLAPLEALGYDVVRNTANLLEPGAPERVIADARPTHLLHLAWNAKPGEYWTTLENLDWVAASLRLLRAFDGERAVFAGTCAEYEWTDETHCVEGETPLVPATPYGTAKHALHTLVEQAGVSAAWGRVFFVFGPHEHPARLASSVASALVRGEPAETGPGTQIRDFLYSEDLAAAFVALLDSEVQGAVNMASGDARPVRELVELLGAAAGREDLLRIGARPANPSEPSVLTASVDRLRDEVAWTPPRTLEQRVEDTIAWWHEHRRA